MRNFRNYQVWKKAHQFSIDIYKVTKQFPKEEMFGLISQLRRASLSIPTNIVEGTGRNSEKEFANFLNIAAGSAAEVEYLIEFSRDIGYIEEEQFKILNITIVEIRKMLNVLHSKVKVS